VRSAYSFLRVLVGFDGSPDAAAALRLAATICDNGELVVLCVIARALPGSNGEGTDGAGLRAEAELLLSELARSAQPGGSARAGIQVVSSGGDSPENVVTRYAAKHDFDLLVLGRRGAGGRRRNTLGRVAERAVHACPVPLLLTSAPGRDAQAAMSRGTACAGRY